MMGRILAVLSYVGMALVFGAVAIRLAGWLNFMAVTPEMDQYAMYAALAGLVLVLLYTLGQWREIAEYFRRRNARYGALTAASVAIVIGILIAVNYLSERHNRRWDLTENQQYSLSEQTVQLLRGLEAPVRVRVFEQELNFDGFRRRLDEYAYHSPLVQVDYIDPEREPLLAQEHEIQVYGTVIIEYMDRTERVTSDSEQDLTNALIKVLDPQERKVYFLGGHGERSLTDTDARSGYSGVADALRRDNYEFDTLVLAQTNQIPDDASIIVIAGPRTDLLDTEVSPLREYLDRGGKLLVLLDPPDDLAQPAALPALTGLLREWGIEATRSIVVDLSGLSNVLTAPVAAPPYPQHAITERFNLITMFPLARAIVPASDAPADRMPQPFVETSARSWAETSLASFENPEELALDPAAGDIPGPVPIGVAVAATAPVQPDPPAAAGEPATEDEDASDDASAGEDPQGEDEPQPAETRIAAIGDADFGANGYLGVQGNSNLFMNTVNWLAQQENLIAIRPREAADRRITLTADRMRLILLLSLLVVPAGVLSAGVYTWWRRR